MSRGSSPGRCREQRPAAETTERSLSPGWDTSPTRTGTATPAADTAEERHTVTGVDLFQQIAIVANTVAISFLLYTTRRRR